MSINPEKEFDCFSCRHSVGVPAGGLLCMRHEKMAVEVCDEYFYEPGTDACEKPSTP